MAVAVLTSPTFAQQSQAANPFGGAWRFAEIEESAQSAVDAVAGGERRPLSIVARRGAGSAASAQTDASRRILSVDHTITVKSMVPSIAGQETAIYVRERVRADVMAGPPSGRAVLFVHGAGAPGEVAFDLSGADYSWAAYLAEAGFDAFVLDLAGYGRSVRPPAMSDPCNLPPDAQRALVPTVIPAPCQPTHVGPLTTIASDVHEIDAVVDYIRTQRRVERVDLVGWSAGGSRVGVWALRNPERVGRVVMLAPGYTRTAPDVAPPAAGPALFALPADAFVQGWQKTATCANQFDPQVGAMVQSELAASDPAGGKWAPGMFRFALGATWGWNASAVSQLKSPTLLIVGATDAPAAIQRTRLLYDDLGATDKVLVDIACASHYVAWERNRHALFSASREWLMTGAIGGVRSGVVKRGYDGP
jgi:pimeloyl-ACP methyl ester carboxylesterase